MHPQKYGVDERSIQRDIDDIKSFLYEQSVNGGDGFVSSTRWQISLPGELKK